MGNDLTTMDTRYSCSDVRNKIPSVQATVVMNHRDNTRFIIIKSCSFQEEGGTCTLPGGDTSGRNGTCNKVGEAWLEV